MTDCDEEDAGGEYHTHGVGCTCFDDLEDPVKDFDFGEDYEP